MNDAEVKNNRDEFLLILRETLGLIASTAKNARDEEGWNNAALLMLRYSAVVESGIVSGMIPAEDCDEFVSAVKGFALICSKHDAKDVVTVFLNSQAEHIGRMAEERKKKH